jgi:RNA polymerase sigma-70 factor, ECF subfamily
MAATPSVLGQPGSGGDSTLGDLLYGDPTKARISEAAWVAIVAAIAAKDARALHALFLRLHRLVFTLAMRISGSRHAAEEVALDVFHEIWRRAQGYSPVDGPVIGWVMNMTRSRAIDRVRHDQRQKRTSPAAAPTPEGGIADADPVEQRQAAARLRTAMSCLSQDERAAIELAYFSDSTYSEVARRLDVPVGTIKSRIRSGLTKLRFALTGEGLP